MAGDLTLYLKQEELRQVKEKLSQLGEVEKSGIVNQGLKEGAKIIAEQAKLNIEQRLTKRTGNLLGSVSVRLKKNSGKAYAGYVRPQGAHAHLLDKGTTIRKTRKGYNRGKNGPYHFHTDAVSQKGEKALDTLIDSINKSIELILNRNK